MSPWTVLSSVCVVALAVSACSTTQSVNVPNCRPARHRGQRRQYQRKKLILGR